MDARYNLSEGLVFVIQETFSRLLTLYPKSQIQICYFLHLSIFLLSFKNKEIVHHALSLLPSGHIVAFASVLLFFLSRRCHLVEHKMIPHPYRGQIGIAVFLSSHRPLRLPRSKGCKGSDGHQDNEPNTIGRALNDHEGNSASQDNTVTYSLK